MTAVLIAALALLALPACVVREPAANARTPAQLVARVLVARWWEPALWALCVTAGPFLLAIWWATRSAVFTGSALAAWLLAKVATLSSADGRRYRLTRTDGMRAIPV